MNIRNLFLVATVTLSLAAVAGCDDGSSTNSGGTGGEATGGKGGDGGTGGATGGAGGDGGTGGSSAVPDMPKLGKQVERMGRPAINTALNNTFNTNPEQTDQAKDGYNANGDRSTWNTQYNAEFRANLAILDSLDTVCGNQLIADVDPMQRYGALAAVLADDRLYVNADGTACGTYLAVEADFLGVTNTDCGGRTLAYDVIDASYTVLATGDLDGSVGDKIPISDAAKGEIFPYLADPQ